jgi:hypothetical protein
MKRRIATVIAVIGMVLVGGHLARVWPRTVEVAYSLGPGVVAVDVDYLKEGEAAASARFEQSDAKTTVVRHAVRLQPGEYQAQITVYRSDGPAIEHTRMLIVPADGLTQFDLKQSTIRSE